MSSLHLTKIRVLVIGVLLLDFGSFKINTKHTSNPTGGDGAAGSNTMKTHQQSVFGQIQLRGSRANIDNRHVNVFNGIKSPNSTKTFNFSRRLFDTSELHKGLKPIEGDILNRGNQDTTLRLD